MPCCLVGMGACVSNVRRGWFGGVDVTPAASRWNQMFGSFFKKCYGFETYGIFAASEALGCKLHFARLHCARLSLFSRGLNTTISIFGSNLLFCDRLFEPSLHVVENCSDISEWQ